MLKSKRRCIGLLTIVAIFIVVQFMAINIASVNAQSYLGQSSDDYFLQTLYELGYDESVAFETDVLYNENLNENGLEYTFKIGESDGYALMINVFDDQGNMYYDIMEIFVDAVSPFDSVNGQKIYIKMFTYIAYIDGIYYDITDDSEIMEEQLDLIVLQGFHYRGTGVLTVTSESIDHYNRISSSYEFANGLPKYDMGSTGGCGAIAGGNLIGYYDIFYENLIPNYTPGAVVGGSWRYFAQGTATTAVINSLYSLMNVAANGGVTVNTFKNGLTSYVNGKGYSITYNSVMSGGSFNYSSYVTQVSAGYPVALFYSKFSITSILGDTNNDILNHYNYAASHVMIGSGYRNISYYNSAGTNFRNDTYLIISSGLVDHSTGYARLNGNSTISDALGVKIY